MPFDDYFPPSGLTAGFAAGRGFFAGLETPMLIRKKLNPLRNESSTLIASILPHPSAQAASYSFFADAGAGAVT